MTRSDAEEQVFDVVAWTAERRTVLYVPAIEASTSIRDPADAETAVRELIADLTGLDPPAIRCQIRFGRPGGVGEVGGGPFGYAD